MTQKIIFSDRLNLFVELHFQVANSGVHYG